MVGWEVPVGAFVYDRSRPIEVDDRTLAHLQLVIIDKLRRGECFALSLSDGERVAMMWLSPFTPVQFIYHGSRRVRVNRLWVEELATNVGLTGVLGLSPEPPEDSPPGTEPKPKEA
jgi:hypothetical protein